MFLTSVHKDQKGLDHAKYQNQRLRWGTFQEKKRKEKKERGKGVSIKKGEEKRKGKGLDKNRCN